MSQPIRKNVPVVAPDFRMKRGAVDRYNGVSAVRVAQARFLWNGTDSSGVANSTTAAHGTGVYLPDNAVIIDAWYDVVTTFTTASADAGTIALTVQSAGDLVTAIAVSDASNVWDAGVRGTKVGNFALDGNAMTQLAMAAARAATFPKLTAEREITVTVATQALTGGDMVIYVAYVLGD
jgi:hypothetical protein